MLILFGGTFDPIHLGHMAIATRLYDVFKRPITFLPTGIPPYKPKSEVTTYDRMEMLKLAINDDSRFLIDDREINRKEFCYTYKTLGEIRSEIGNNEPIFFIIGGDSLVSLDSWDNWETLFDLANFIVVGRNQYGQELMSGILAKEFLQRQEPNLNKFLTAPCGKIYTLEFKPIDISSTQIRQNIKNNLPIDTLVSAKVENFIRKHELYKNM